MLALQTVASQDTEGSCSAPDVGVYSAGLQPPGPQPLPVADGGVPAGWGHQRGGDDLTQQTSLLGISGQVVTV